MCANLLLNQGTAITYVHCVGMDRICSLTNQDIAIIRLHEKSHSTWHKQNAARLWTMERKMAGQTVHTSVRFPADGVRGDDTVCHHRSKL